MIYEIPLPYLVFPHPSLSNEEGVLGVGGDLTPERLLLAYRFGIFPWYNEGGPIFWWSTNPRLVLKPEEIKVSKSMRPYFNQRKFQVSFDLAFEDVISQCALHYRPNQSGTWLTEEMQDAYCALHEMGYAHSVEVWCDDLLVGGLYGVSLYKVFFGESMFASMSNASKFGFISLAKALQEGGFQLIDCQQSTNHLKSLGAKDISRSSFMDILRRNAFQHPYPLFWEALRSKGKH